jgi:hypothetical protein
MDNNEGLASDVARRTFDVGYHIFGINVRRVIE